MTDTSLTSAIATTPAPSGVAAPPETSPVRRPPAATTRLVRALALAAVCWGLTWFTEFRTDVALTVEPDRLIWEVDGGRQEAKIRVTTVDEIAIRAAESPFAMGGRSLVVESAGQTVFQHALPRAFAVPRGAVAAVGDWTVDERLREDVVLRLPVVLRPPFVLRATFTGRCLKFTTLRLRQTAGDPLVVSFRRGLINSDSYIERGSQHEIAAGGSLPTNPWPHVLSSIDFVVRGLLAAALLVAAFAAMSWLPVGAGALRGLTGLAQRRSFRLAAGAAVVAVSFAITTWVAASVLEKVVHTPDEVAYQLQTRWLRAGRLYQDKPPIHEYLGIPFTFVKNERWMTQYPIGWPLVLAVGDVLGVPWLVNPVLGVLALILIVCLGREVGDLGLGLIAMLFAALSPMWHLMFGSRLSHGAAACAVLTFAWLFLRSLRTGGRTTMALAGLAIGFAAGIRPLTAAAMAVPFGLFWLFDSTSRRQLLRLALPLAAGAVLGLAPALVANARLTGHPLLFAYKYVGNHDLRFEHVRDSVAYLDSTLASMLPVLTGWGWGLLRGWPALLLPIGLALAPFVLGRATRRDVLLAAAFAALPCGYLLHNDYGLHGYGPRFYFEGFFALYLLAARGLLELAAMGADQGRRLAAWVALALVLGLSAWNLVVTRERLGLFRGYNAVSGDLERALREKNVTRGVVLLSPGDWYDWGRVANLLPAEPQADLVFAQPIEGGLGPLLSFYPGRPLWTWSLGKLQPFRPVINRP